MKSLVAKTFFLLIAVAVLVLAVLHHGGGMFKIKHTHTEQYTRTGKSYLQATDSADTTTSTTTVTRSKPTVVVSSMMLNKTYVAVLQLDGQQGSGMRSLSVLQCMLGSFYSHFYIVEPYFGESNVGTYTGKRDNGGMNFSSLFDFDSFNVESRKMSYPEMATLDEYVQLSPKYVIYVRIRDKFSKQAVMWSAERNGNKTVRCFDGETGLVQQFHPFISGTQKRFNAVKPHHCIVRVVELHVTRIDDEYRSTKVRLTSTIYNMVFGKWSPHDVSLVFTYYYNKLYIPVDVPLHGINCMHSYANYETKVQFKPSARLLKDAKKYEDMFLGGRNTLAIMIRIERILRYYVKENSNPNKPKSLEECFEGVLNVSKSSKNLKPVVTLDVGRFGTKTSHTFLNESIIQLSKRMLSALYNDKWSPNEWEGSFSQAANGETSGAYIAALQRILASRADCLILMGGGSFQALAVQDYFQYHNRTSEKCLHLVCVMTRRNIEVQKTMNNFLRPPR